MDPNMSKSELLDRFKEDEDEFEELSRIEESELLQSPRFKRLQSSSPPRSGSSSPTKSSAGNEHNSSFDVIPKLEYKRSNPLLRTPTKPKTPNMPLQQLNTRPQPPRFLPMSPSKSHHYNKLPEMKVSLTPAQRMEKKPGRLLNTNDILSQYDFKETVGRGAFANVYRAINKQTGNEVAVKEIIIEDDDNVLELMCEIDLLKVLKHKNIVKYHGFLRNEKKLFIFLEYCSGGSLRNIYRKNGPLPEEQVIKYMNEVLEGLIYLHEQGVVHRDVKAANILLTNKGDIKLTDFGVSTTVSNKTIKTRTIAGTPNWMAPEIISMDGTSTASDVWSLGATVVELIAGEPLYAHLNEMAALHAIVTDDYPPIPQFITPLCKDFLMKCFEKQPQKRITAKELRNHSWLKSAHPIRPHSVVDSMVLRHKKSKSNTSFNDNDFNSIKRHNTRKFLPMEVSTFKHTDLDLNDLIDNELVDEFADLDIKKADKEYRTNVFNPMVTKEISSKMEQLKQSLLDSPYDESIILQIISAVQSNKNDIDAFDAIFLGHIIHWIESVDDADTPPCTSLIDLTTVLVLKSQTLMQSFVDLGGIALLASFTGGRTDKEMKTKCVKVLSIIVKSSSENLLLFVQSGSLKKSLKLLEEDINESHESLAFIVETVYNAFKDRVTTRETLQIMTLNFANFLDWIAVLLLHYINTTDTNHTEMCVSIIGFTRGSPLLKPSPILLNSIFKIHDKLSKKQQIRLLKFIKSFNTGELPETPHLVKFLVKTVKRASISKQLDNDILNLSCAMLFNVCHLNQERQMELVKCDSLPIFQKLLGLTLPCTEFIIPLLCGLSFNDSLTSKLLKSEYGVLEEFLGLLIDPVWQANAMDALVTLHERVGGDKIPRLLLSNGCQFLIRGMSMTNSLNYELFLSRLNRFLGLYPKSMVINQIRLVLFNNDGVVASIMKKIQTEKDELVIQVDLFKLLKTLSVKNYQYVNYGKIVKFVKSLKKTNVLMIDQLVQEIIQMESNKENAMMKPPQFNVPSVMSHTVFE